LLVLVGSLILAADGLIADKRTNYGVERALAKFGYVTLGSTESEDGRTRTESGFQGKLTRVQMWQKALDVTSQIPRQVRPEKLGYFSSKITFFLIVQQPRFHECIRC
jgi:hypothetical protein